MSLVGALTPLGKVAHDYWLRAVAAYTVAGSVSASLVGALLGSIGHGFRAAGLYWCAVALALALATRELGWLRFQLPQRERQTEKVWAHEFGFVTAAAMWGFHIGLGFATYVRHWGFWVLTLVAFAVGEPAYGAALMLLYWLGRAMPVWVMPLIWQTRDTRELMEAISANRLLYNRSEALALVWSAGIVLIWVLQGWGLRSPHFIIGHTP
jgi:cytochrome c biogenesis protein CcdA